MKDFVLTLGRTSTLFNKHGKTNKGKYQIQDYVVDNSIKWTTDLNFSAGQLDFELQETKHPIIPYTGDAISFVWQGHKIFYGRVFKYSVDESNRVKVTCYDNTRYLKNQDSIVFKAGTLSERFSEVLSHAGLSGKVVAGSGHKLKPEVDDSKSYFDMLKNAIDQTATATGQRYFVLANYGSIELRKVPYKRLNIVVGSKSGMTGFTYSVDIENTYNSIRVVQKNEKKSQSTSATAKGKDKGGSDDASNTSFTATGVKGKSVAQWGVLQEVINAKEKANEAQMLEQAKGELKLKNNANKTLSIECIGNVDLVAGNAVTIKITDLNKKISNCPIVKAVHTFGTDYKCSLEMKAGESWQANS